jgi:hypothetical protein
MRAQELQTALEALPAELIQRLTDRLEADPDMRVTVGHWHRCPMTIAGVDRFEIVEDGPEHRFASAWDRYASAASRLTWRHFPVISASAAKADVQTLLRLANATLAARSGTRLPADEPVAAK